jgi:hypothetical protein
LNPLFLISFNMKQLFPRILLLFVLVCWIGSVRAQENRYLIGFRYGYSLPMGQFASHEYTYGAYALLGSTFSAEGSRYLRHGLGIGVNFSIGFYPIATGYYLEDMDSSDAFGVNFRMKSSPYEIRTYTAGVYYRLPVSGKFSASFKALGGICWAKSPDQFFVADYFGQGDFFWRKTSARSTKPSFLIGASIRYALFEHVDLLLDSEFSYAESKFAFWKDNGTRKVYEYMKMPLFKLQPGINITF